jgi:hypothetical protein
MGKGYPEWLDRLWPTDPAELANRGQNTWHVDLRHCADDHANSFWNIQLGVRPCAVARVLSALQFFERYRSIAEWHQNQIPPGETEIGCDARAFGTDWAFGDLHNHVRADRVDARYVFYRDPFSRALVRLSVNFFDPLSSAREWHPRNEGTHSFRSRCQQTSPSIPSRCF